MVRKRAVPVAIEVTVSGQVDRQLIQIKKHTLIVE
jgi:hypothetical protein